MKHSLIRRGVFLVLELVLIQAAAFAQGEAHARHEGEAELSVPREILERPVTLRSGIGRVHQSVTTSSKEAQAFYDQGLAYLHSYVWIEAARSFNQALRLDPALAMAYAGLSRAYSGLNISEAARQAFEKAEALGRGASPREQRFIALRKLQLEAMSDLANASLHQNYKRALDQAIAAYPDDLELLLLRGNAEEPAASGRGQRGTEASILFYERALGLDPACFAAHHFLIHSFENLNRIEEALRHGEAYVRLVPDVPHARHMYGHDLRRVGRITDALEEFRKAYELEIAYYKRENIPARYDWHHQHNLDLLSTSYQYRGQMRQAERFMRESFEVEVMQDALAFNKKEWPEFLLSRGRTEEALRAAETLAGSPWEIVSAIGHIMASRALMAMGRLPEAGAEAKAALELARGSARTIGFVNQYLSAVQGEFFLRTGQAEKGRSILKAVQAGMRAEPGPDAWIQALFRLEAIARLARETNDWELAEYTARQMLDHDPAYGGTHYALALVRDHKGEQAAALKEFALAEKYWRDGDTDMPELQKARERRASLGK